MDDLATDSVESKPRRSKNTLFKLVLVLIVLGLASVAALRFLQFSDSPVPKSIREKTSFAIYYPNQNNLPQGYKLDQSSFRKVDGDVVLFSVSYGSGQQIIFSEQNKPVQNVIDKFHDEVIPVHTEQDTPIGKAVIGANGKGSDLKTIASLPVNKKGPWLIVTAPSDINQEHLKQVILSLTK